jgi:type II secretory pathway component PulF
MAESISVEMSDAEAVELIEAAEYVHEREVNPPLTQAQRLYCAIPMFVASMLIGVMIRLCSTFKEFYDEASMSDALPPITAMFVYGSTFIVHHPWVLPCLLFLIEWMYFRFIARRRRDIFYFNVAICISCLTLMWLTPVVLLLPYIRVSECGV